MKEEKCNCPAVDRVDRREIVEESPRRARRVEEDDRVIDRTDRIVDSPRRERRVEEDDGLLRRGDRRDGVDVDRVDVVEKPRRRRKIEVDDVDDLTGRAVDRDFLESPRRRRRFEDDDFVTGRGDRKEIVDDEDGGPSESYLRGYTQGLIAAAAKCMTNTSLIGSVFS